VSTELPVRDSAVSRGPHPGGAAAAAGVTCRVRSKDGWPVRGAVLTVTDLAGSQAARADATLGTITLDRAAGADLPAPGRWTIDPAHSAVTITARHMGLASVRGVINDFSGTIDIAEPAERSTVRARMRADSIDTGNQMRDDHLRSPDFLDVLTYPLIEYTGTGVTPHGDDRWTVDGELTLHGTTRPVQLDLTCQGTGPDPWGGKRAAFRATAELHRKDFAINWNQLVAAEVVLVGWVLRIVLDIEAVQGELPEM